MGCGSSKPMEAAVSEDDLNLFAAMKLTKDEVRLFYKNFRKVDMDHSGYINVVELLTMIDSERTHFTERVFRLFDQDGSGRVNFREFVLSIWNYCTLTQASLDLFTFDLYDEDGTGILSIDEVHNMLKEIYGKHFEKNPRARQIEHELMKIDKARDLNIEAFQMFVKTHHNLLFPAFQLQQQMQKHIMGPGFWRKASNRRIQLSKGQYITMAELMELHLHEDLYRKVVENGVVHGRKAKLDSRALKVIEATGTAHGRSITDEEHYRGSLKSSQDSHHGGGRSSSKSRGSGKNRSGRSDPPPPPIDSQPGQHQDGAQQQQYSSSKKGMRADPTHIARGGGEGGGEGATGGGGSRRDYHDRHGGAPPGGSNRQERNAGTRGSREGTDRAGHYIGDHDHHHNGSGRGKVGNNGHGDDAGAHGGSRGNHGSQRNQRHGSTDEVQMGGMFSYHPSDDTKHGHHGSQRNSNKGSITGSGHHHRNHHDGHVAPSG